MRIAAVLIIGYLLGSIPFGYLIVRATAGADVRETGSGGTGATNVTRRAGRWAGVLTLLLDAAKGAAAVLIASVIIGQSETPIRWIAYAGVMAIVGHCFPVWLRFRGGKGVATALGVFTVLSPWTLLVFAAVFLLLAATTRYVSLGSIVGILSIPICTFLQIPSLWHQGLEIMGYHDAEISRFFAAVATAAIVVFMHRENIKRLRAGTENKFK